MENLSTSVLRDLDGIVVTTGLHHDDFVGPVDHGLNATRDPMGFVFGNYEAGDRQFPAVALLKLRHQHHPSEHQSQKECEKEHASVNGRLRASSRRPQLSN
jgi:hypothetical protein